jgi:hypothetical protein
MPDTLQRVVDKRRQLGAELLTIDADIAQLRARSETLRQMIALLEELADTGDEGSAPPPRRNTNPGSFTSRVLEMIADQPGANRELVLDRFIAEGMVRRDALNQLGNLVRTNRIRKDEHNRLWLANGKEAE